MKTLLTILLFLIFCNSYSQRLNCETITKHSVFEIFDGLVQNKYSINESKCFGENLAKYDRQRGIKRILTLDGPFDTGCAKCIYYKFGFEKIVLGPNDIDDDNITQFMESYNGIMESILSKEQKKDYDKSSVKSKLIFDSFLTTLNHYKIERINDSTLNFKMHSDTLEYLFQSDIQNLLIEIGDSFGNPNNKVLKYNDLKSRGLDIPIGNESKKKLFICFDFSNMPNRFDLCWCKILQNKYSMILPVKIK